MSDIVTTYAIQHPHNCNLYLGKGGWTSKSFSRRFRVESDAKSYNAEMELGGVIVALPMAAAAAARLP